MRTMIGVPIGTEHYVIFAFFMVLAVALYLRFGHRKPATRSVGFAMAESGIWIILAAAFCAGIGLSLGPGYSADFGYGFFIESMLSMDNLLLFSIVFSAYGVPEAYRSYLLSWGILWMMASRGLLVAVGGPLLLKFGWLSIVFGAILVTVGAKVLLGRGGKAEGFLVTAFKSDAARGLGLSSLRGSKLLVAPMAVVATVELIDAMSATDSVSAILTVSHHPFVAYASDVLAAIAMRTLYTVVNVLLRKYRFLESSLAVVAMLVGLKMIADRFVHIPLGWSILADVAAVAVPSAYFFARGTASRLPKPEKPKADALF